MDVRDVGPELVDRGRVRSRRSRRCGRCPRSAASPRNVLLTRTTRRPSTVVSRTSVLGPRDVRVPREHEHLVAEVARARARASRRRSPRRPARTAEIRGRRREFASIVSRRPSEDRPLRSRCSTASDAAPSSGQTAEILAERPRDRQSQRAADFSHALPFRRPQGHRPQVQPDRRRDRARQARDSSGSFCTPNSRKQLVMQDVGARELVARRIDRASGRRRRRARRPAGGPPAARRAPTRGPRRSASAGTDASSRPTGGCTSRRCRTCTRRAAASGAAWHTSPGRSRPRVASEPRQALARRSGA